MALWVLTSGEGQLLVMFKRRSTCCCSISLCCGKSPHRYGIQTLPMLHYSSKGTKLPGKLWIRMCDKRTRIISFFSLLYITHSLQDHACKISTARSQLHGCRLGLQFWNLIHVCDIYAALANSFLRKFSAMHTIIMQSDAPTSTRDLRAWAELWQVINHW